METLGITALSWGLEGGSRASMLITMFVLVRVGFFCLLRPGELVNLRVGDVRLPGAGALTTSAVLAIRSPKNKRYFGQNQFVIVEDVVCIMWLRWLLRGLPREVTLWPSSPESFRVLFKKVSERCGLGNLRLVPAGLRPGGTTHLVSLGLDLSRIQFLGRWRVQSTMQVYVQEAMSSLVLVSMSQSQVNTVSQITSQASQFVRNPPSLAWPYIFSRHRQWRSSSVLRK